MVLRRSANSSRKGCWGTVTSPKTRPRVRQDDLYVKYRLLYVLYGVSSCAGATWEVQVPSVSIVNIGSNKPTFWRQLQGTIDFGYSFTSGNSQSTLNADTSAKYRTKKWEAATSFDSTFSGQSGASSTNREDIQLTVSRFLNRNSFVAALSDFLHSSRQDLNLRTTLGGGYGRFLKRTTNSNLAWLGGAVYIHESFDTTAGQPSGQSIEAVVGLQ